MAFLKECFVKTGKTGAYNITDQIKQAVEESAVTDGLAIVFCPHTTASIIITENTDPQLGDDLLLGLNLAFPERGEYRHRHGNAFAHIQSAVVGGSIQLIIDSGWLLLGPFQSVQFLEFDGPRERHFYIKVFEC